MTGERLSRRKLESYRRAEVVAQAARKVFTAGYRVQQPDYDVFADAILDWMAVTGQLKYAAPVRRSRKKWGSSR